MSLPVIPATRRAFCVYGPARACADRPDLFWFGSTQAVSGSAPESHEDATPLIYQVFWSTGLTG